MIPKEVIEKAIDGGWRAFDVAVSSFTGEAENYEKVALDPSFWQALGEALEWGDGDQRNEIPVWDWKGYAMEFYDLILTNGDTKKFWDELLSPTNKEV